jgi:ElaB/YqjD/DUF883 family membrane-anchored ribosome-binding protein
VTSSNDPQQIERDIEQTRAELGDTVEALARKTDLKARARQKADEVKTSMGEKKEQLFGRAKQASPEGTSQAAAQVARMARQNPLPIGAAGLFIAGFLVGRVSKR